MIATQSKLGYGVYSIPAASRIVGVTPKRMRRWISTDTELFQSRFTDDSISFLDLVELMFIKMFRDENVSLQTIRKAAEKAADRFNTDYPFAVKRFDTDGKTIFATLKSETSDEDVIEDLRRSQLVFKQVIRPFFKKLEYGEHDVMQYWPLQKSGNVVLDPERSLGQPIDAKTGVPTKALYDAVMAGGGQDIATVAKWFDVPKRAVSQAVRFEKGL